MDNAAMNAIDTLHELSLQLLVRLSADLTALEALASAEETVPDRKASAALFHHSAQKGCCQMQQYLTVLHHLAQGGSEEEKEWLPRTDGTSSHRHSYD